MIIHVYKRQKILADLVTRKLEEKGKKERERESKRENGKGQRGKYGENLST